MIASPEKIETSAGSRRVARFGPYLAALLVAGLAGCGNFNSASRSIVGMVSPYKIDVLQGNFVSSEQVAALKPGMPRSQVRDILGTPLLTDVFHSNRWDYVFTYKRGNADPVSRRLTVFFAGDALDRFQSDEMPTEAEFVATLESGRKPGKAPLLEAAEEKLEKFAPRAPLPGPSPADPVQSTPLPSSYPPLEVPAR